MQHSMIDIGIKLHVREWSGEKTPFLLVHGLASNSLLWVLVAEELAAAGHYVAAVDQRGHGLSEKPDSGYDFATLTGDLRRLIDALELDRPVIVGQSWGGSVVLEFGARYPGVARGLGLIDGGFIHLSTRPDGDWETIVEKHTPPDLTGTPYNVMRQRLVNAHPDWADAAIDGFMANFERLPNDTLRSWLTLNHHRQILRALWKQNPPALYPQISDPVLLCPAAKNGVPAIDYAREWVAAAESTLPRVTVHWFEDSDHDIQAHHPAELTALMLETLDYGIWQT